MKIVKTLCRRCGNQTGTLEKENSKKDSIIDKNRYCNDCVEKYRQHRDDRMKNHNPVKQQSTRDKISNTLKRKYKTGEISSPFLDAIKLKEIHSKRKGLSNEGSAIISRRMKTKNPMFDAKIRKRVSVTINERIKSGKLVYKKGHFHHLYKGTRTFSNDCRKWLKVWIKSILKRDKFSCTVCGRIGGYLHTHHIRPLRDIIKTVLTIEGVVDIVSVKLNDISRYEQLIQKIVDAHKMEDGITVCKQCHANIDDRYRRIKKTT
jgi:hypothetical protein